jgi:hypothetical protein
LVVLAALVGCGAEVPPSLLLTINQTGSGAPDSVRVRVFDAQQVAHEVATFQVSPSAQGGGLGTVVVYPRRPDALVLRVQAEALAAGAVQASGTGVFTLRSGAQTHATLTLAAGVSDRDGDGVVDAIDNCVATKNPGQEDADGDGKGDACAGGSPDGGAPDLDPGDVPAGEDAPDAGADAFGLRATGLACSAGSECVSGHCVDGVCCQTSCADACRACNLPDRRGVCAPVPAGEVEPRGACAIESTASCGRDGTCDGAGACRKYPAGTVCAAAGCAGATDRLLPATCDGMGVCTEPRRLSCAPYVCAAGACPTACAGPEDCASGDGCVNGACGEKPLGAPCAGATECNSGSCVDSVCCDVASCSGPCRACNLPGSAGSCQNVAASAEPRAGGCAAEDASTCGRTGKCDGAGGCQLQPPGMPCGARTCMGSTEAAAPTCNGNGACVPGLVRSCGAYLCSDGTCGSFCATDAACTGTAFCRNGSCVPRQPSGASCTQARECASGACVDGFCCQTTSCAAGMTCSGTDGTCIGRRGLGSSCTAADECESGFCADGVCCASACGEPCRRCNGAMPGTCELLISGRDNNATPPCTAPKRCTEGGVCR